MNQIHSLQVPNKIVFGTSFDIKVTYTAQLPAPPPVPPDSQQPQSAAPPNVVLPPPIFLDAEFEAKIEPAAVPTQPGKHTDTFQIVLHDEADPSATRDVFIVAKLGFSIAKKSTSGQQKADTP
ncbi:MAG TPA: hypothetical protein VK550_02235 [Polyangiaceae bacterium]|nr:hypothetical protein [Polyangiaceae bacterium]